MIVIKRRHAYWLACHLNSVIEGLFWSSLTDTYVERVNCLTLWMNDGVNILCFQSTIRQNGSRFIIPRSCRCKNMQDLTPIHPRFKKLILDHLHYIIVCYFALCHLFDQHQNFLSNIFMESYGFVHRSSRRENLPIIYEKVYSIKTDAVIRLMNLRRRT